MRRINVRRCLWSSPRVWIRTDLLLEGARRRCNVCKSMPLYDGTGSLAMHCFKISLWSKCLTAQCNGSGIITPLSWGLPLHKPRSSSRATLCCQQLQELAGKWRAADDPVLLAAWHRLNLLSRLNFGPKGWLNSCFWAVLSLWSTRERGLSHQMQFEKHISSYLNSGVNLKTHGKLFTLSSNGFNLPFVFIYSCLPVAYVEATGKTYMSSTHKEKLNNHTVCNRGS